MDIKRAIRLLDCLAAQTTPITLGDECVIALEMAIKALKKQIPTKPDLEADGYADGNLVYDTWVCPCCETHYEVDYDDYEFCPECGQAIDRSGWYD